MTRKRKDRERRKAVRRQRLLAKTKDSTGSPRLRRFFFGKARAGDVAEVKIAFSGDTVPVDEHRPSESLAERDAALKEWEKDGFPTEGDA